MFFLFSYWCGIWIHSRLLLFSYFDLLRKNLVSLGTDVRGRIYLSYNLCDGCSVETLLSRSVTAPLGIQPLWVLTTECRMKLCLFTWVVRIRFFMLSDQAHSRDFTHSFSFTRLSFGLHAYRSKWNVSNMVMFKKKNGTLDRFQSLEKGVGTWTLNVIWQQLWKAWRKNTGQTS